MEQLRALTPSSFNRFFQGGALTRDGVALPQLRAHRGMRFDVPLNVEDLRGRFGRVRGQRDGAARLSQGLDKRLGPARRFGFRDKAAARFGGFDARQRAVVKIHYFGHAGGGAAALKAHARYVAREAAGRDVSEDTRERADREPDRSSERQTRDHAGYLSRGSEAPSPFYDALAEGVDGAGRMAVWAHEDRRHFRIILAPEKGAELGDLKPYVRDVMARAATAMGARLEWVAVDHHDTDNPHTHIVLRGRRANGRPLIIPRDFVRHGFRDAARDAATERLGLRTRDDERLALAREVRAHRPTRLDTLIKMQLGKDGSLILARLEAPNGDPALTNALKARARELQRLGLASEPRRNVLSMRSDWRERLRAMELHLDIRKKIMLSRTPSRSPNLPDLSKGPFLGR